MSTENKEMSHASLQPVSTSNPEKKKKNKKKKKKSYKSLIKSIIGKPKTDAEVKAAHQAKIKSVLGGGQFSKIDKI